MIGYWLYKQCYITDTTISILLVKGTRDKKHNKETDTTAIMLYSLKKVTGHKRPKDKSTNKNKKTMR